MKLSPFIVPSSCIATYYNWSLTLGEVAACSAASSYFSASNNCNKTRIKSNEIKMQRTNLPC